MLRGLALGFALFLFDNFLAQFSFGGEGAAVDDAKGFFLFVLGVLIVGQVRFLSSFVHFNFSIGVFVWVAAGRERS